jgi:hypothetical protein
VPGSVLTPSRQDSFCAKSAALSARQKSSSCLRFLSDLTSSFLLAASVVASFHLSMTPSPMIRDAEGRGFWPSPVLLRPSSCLNGDGFAALTVSALKQKPASLRGLGRAPDYRPVGVKSAVGQTLRYPCLVVTARRHFGPCCWPPCPAGTAASRQWN